MSKKIKKRPPSPFTKTLRDPAHTLQEALRLHQAGRFDEAENLYRQILAAQPRHSDALNLLATLYQQRGEFNRAIPLLHQAIALKPERPDYHSNLGSAFRSLAQQEKAMQAFRKALALQPGHLESQFNLALCAMELGKLAEAAEGLQTILLTKPTFIPAHEMLAQALIGQGLLSEALATCREIVRLAPDNRQAFIQIGNILQAQGEWPEAVTAYRQAIALSPDSAAAHNNLGNTLIKQGKIHEAMACYQEALRYNPELAEAYVNLSWVYKEHGQIADDVRCLQGYLARHPEDFKAHSDMLFSMNYDPRYSPEQLAAAAQGWWHQHAPRPSALFVHPSRPHSDRLRIGFLSPDFRVHPVGTFLLPLFKALDKQQVTLHCYAELQERQMDSVSHALRGLAESWCSTSGLSSQEAATRIHQDQLDILIDLAGHSANNRLDIMALQPAPIQASWLGYVNTTGLPVIHYRLSDAMADPPGQDPFYSETLVRLPDAFFCYEPPTESPAIGPLPALSQGRITLGSLNNPAKISEEVITLWSKILVQLPDARLLLVGTPFVDASITERYHRLFASQGVEPERIELLPSLPMQEYLELYNRIDIALDPFPHNGHTITCHTLWMGVPVVTLAGNRYASRMGASVLHFAGFPELIADNEEDYLARTVALARDLDRLAILRQTLRERLRHSVVCDTDRFANNFLLTMHDLRSRAQAK